MWVFQWIRVGNLKRGWQGQERKRHIKGQFFSSEAYSTLLLHRQSFHTIVEMVIVHKNKKRQKTNKTKKKKNPFNNTGLLCRTDNARRTIPSWCQPHSLLSFIGRFLLYLKHHVFLNQFNMTGTTFTNLYMLFWESRCKIWR